MRGFNVTMDYALHGISYANLLLLGASLPRYDGTGRDGAPGDDGFIDATDPGNAERINAIFDRD